MNYFFFSFFTLAPSARMLLHTLWALSPRCSPGVLSAILYVNNELVWSLRAHGTLFLRIPLVEWFLYLFNTIGRVQQFPYPSHPIHPLKAAKTDIVLGCWAIGSKDSRTSFFFFFFCYISRFCSRVCILFISFYLLHFDGERVIFKAGTNHSSPCVSTMCFF